MTTRCRVLTFARVLYELTYPRRRMPSEQANVRHLEDANEQNEKVNTTLQRRSEAARSAQGEVRP